MVVKCRECSNLMEKDDEDRVTCLESDVYFLCPSCGASVILRVWNGRVLYETWHIENENGVKDYSIDRFVLEV